MPAIDASTDQPCVIPAPPPKRPRVLLADDHKLMRDSVRRLLETKFDVAADFEDCQSLLDAVDDLQPDVLVLDISMPQLNGMDAARRLRGTGCQAKIVFLTAYSDADFARDALSNGALGYVVKTHMMSDLIRAVLHALDGQQFVSPAIPLEERA